MGAAFLPTISLRAGGCARAVRTLNALGSGLRPGLVNFSVFSLGVSSTPGGASRPQQSLRGLRPGLVNFSVFSLGVSSVSKIG